MMAILEMYVTLTFLNNIQEKIQKRKERYRIPPWNEFVNVQEVYLLQIDAVEKMENEKESSSAAKKSKLDTLKDKQHSENEDDSDILIVDTRPNSGGLEDGEIPSERMVDLETNVTVRRRKVLVFEKLIPNKIENSKFSGRTC